MAPRKHPRAYVALATTPGPAIQVLYPGYGRTDWLSAIENWGTQPHQSFIQTMDVSTPGFMADWAMAPTWYNEYVWTAPTLTKLAGFPHEVQPYMATIMVDTRGYKQDTPWGTTIKHVNAHVDLNYFDDLHSHLHLWNDRGIISGQSPFPALEFTGTQDRFTLSGLKSRFTLPANPILCLALWQAEIWERDEDLEDPDKGIALTEITLGESAESAFRVRFPNLHNQPPTIIWRHQNYTSNQWVPMERVEAGGQLTNWGTNSLDSENWASGEQSGHKYLWIGCFREGIALSTDAFTSETLFFRPVTAEPTPALPSDVAEFVEVNAAPFKIEHVGGKWRFAFLPVVMAEHGHFLSQHYELPYKWGANPSPPTARPIVVPVADKVNGALVTRSTATAFDVVGNEVYSYLTTEDRFYQYVAKVDTTTDTVDCTSGEDFGQQQANHLPDDTPLHFYMSRSPLLYGVSYLRGSGYQDRSPFPYSWISLKNLTLSYDFEGSGAASGEITVDHQLGQFAGYLYDLSPYYLTAYGTWVNEDDSEEVLAKVFEGYLGNRSGGMTAGKVSLSAQLVDPGQSALDLESTGDLCAFDGFGLTDRNVDYVWNVICYLVGIHGVTETLIDPSNPGGEGEIANLNIGPVGRPYWVCEAGRSYRSFLDEVALYAANAKVWVKDGQLRVGCPYCGVSRNGIPGHVNYWAHHAGPASYGCVARDIETSGNAWGVHWPLYFNEEAAVATYGSLGDDHLFRWNILDFNVPRLQVDESYYNEVAVVGPAYNVPDRDSLTTVMTDWPSVQGSGSWLGTLGYSLGRRKRLTLEYGWANNAAIRNRLAYMNFYNVALRPETVEVKVPFMPWAACGQVFSIAGGGGFGVHGKKYRITALSHENVAINNPGCTTLVGRYIGYLG